MGNGMNKVLPGLYLGNCRDAKDMEQLKANNITHVLSIHDNAQAILESVRDSGLLVVLDSEPMLILQHLDYKCIQVADHPDVDLTPYFRECIYYIHKCRIEDGACLVHCIAGISRSTTIVAAYIMTVTTLNWRQVLKAIKCKRPITSPNYGFQRQLQDFGNKNLENEKEILKMRCPVPAKFKDEETLRECLASSDASTDVDDEIPSTLNKYHNRKARVTGDDEPEGSSSASSG